MSKTIHESAEKFYSAMSTDRQKRGYAVAMALEVIAAKVSNSPASSNQLTYELENLSRYATQIQQALEGQ